MNLTLRKDADAIIASSLNPAGRSCPPRAESLCAQGRQGAAGRSGQGRMADGTRGSGSAGPCGRRRGRDQIRACQGRDPGSKLL